MIYFNSKFDDIDVGKILLKNNVLLIKESNSKINIYNPYNSNMFIYIKVTNDSLLIVDDPFFNSSLNLSNLNIFKYINNLDVGELSIFNEDYENLPHGCYLTIINNRLVKKQRIVNKSNIDKDPVRCLENVLNKYVNENNIAISFSGGLDSTAILYACNNIFINKNIIAFNWWNDGCSNNDLETSKEICEKLNIKLLTIKIEPKELMEKLDFEKHVIPNYPASYLDFIGFIEKYSNELQKQFNFEPFTIINGTGGDQLFLEAIPFECIVNLEFKKIIEFTKLYSLNYPLVFKKYINYKINKNKFNEKLYRENSIYESLCLTSTTFTKNNKFNYFFPFSTIEMIESSLNFKLNDSFNKDFCRYNFRKLLSEKYKSNDFYREGKGSMTGAFQKSLHLNKDYIFKTIFNGYLIKNKIIDISDILKKIELNSIGVFGVDPKIMIPFIFESILIAHKEKYEK